MRVGWGATTLKVPLIVIVDKKANFGDIGVVKFDLDV